MDIQLRIADEGLLVCDLTHNGQHLTLRPVQAGRSLEAFAAALEDLMANGLAECFWEQPYGVYRWMFRQNGENLLVAVNWSTGVVTGWEHVFWAEGPCGSWSEKLRRALEKVTVPERGA